jgi:dihydroorotate dehydrogenase
LFGLRFPNRVGIAAGFDKNGVCIDGLAALVNRLGFINLGVDRVVDNLRRRKFTADVPAGTSSVSAQHAARDQRDLQWS